MDGTEGGEKTGAADAREKPGQDAVFHYSRERRLEKAPAAVRGLYQDAPPRRGFGRFFQGNPSGIWIFLSILLVAVFMSLFSFLNRREAGQDLEGNRVAVGAVKARGETWLTVKKEVPGAGAFAGEVELAVSVPREEGGAIPPIERQSIVFSREKSEEFRFSVPLEAEELIILIRAGGTVRRFRIRPQ